MLNKPHRIFLLSIPVILLIGFLNIDAYVNINVHDTYLVLRQLDVAVLISIVFGLIGLSYWMLRKVNRRLSKRLNLIHMALTVGGILFIWILGQFYRESIKDYDFNDNLTVTIYVMALIAIFGQLFFVINIIGGLLKKTIQTRV